MEKNTGFTAKAKFLLVSPVKVRRIARVLNKKPYGEAMAMLEALPQKGARLLKKVIASAAANALYKNKKLDEGMLYIKKLTIEDGPRMRRLWARARGRADMLLKRMSHIFVEVDEIAKAGGKK